MWWFLLIRIVRVVFVGAEREEEFYGAPVVVLDGREEEDGFFWSERWRWEGVGWML